jgi:hypothetical protein
LNSNSNLSDNKSASIACKGNSVVSQAHIYHDTTSQPGGLTLNPEAFYVLHRRIDTESVQYRARFQSLLRRVIKLENSLDDGRTSRTNRSLHRERIQLGLDVSVAGERRMFAPGLPFMIVLLAFVATVAPTVYKYVLSA